MNKSIVDKLNLEFKKEEIISPFLLLGDNFIELNLELNSILSELTGTHKVPKNFIFRLEDSLEKIKVEEIRKFIEKSNVKPSYKFQIFIIENISRLTLQSSNALLKFLEEPPVGNIVFLTNLGENGVLETILSRVSTYNLGVKQKKSYNSDYYNLIDNFCKYKDTEVFAYFFKAKTEKKEATEFLFSLLEYIKNTRNFINLLDEIEEDLLLLNNNNLLAKYVVDKYILKIKESLI